MLEWDKDKRAAYYRDVEKRRGRLALERLLADVKREWAKSHS